MTAHDSHGMYYDRDREGAVMPLREYPEINVYVFTSLENDSEEIVYTREEVLRLDPIEDIELPPPIIED